MISASFVISAPILHFLWVISSFLLAFYALSAITTYGAASTFALVIAVGIPIWERHVSAETNVEDTLWLTLAVSTGVVVTAVIELAVARVHCWRTSHRDRLGDTHLAACRFDWRIHSLFHTCHDTGLLGHDIEPTSVIFRLSNRRDLLSH